MFWFNKRLENYRSKIEEHVIMLEELKAKSNTQGIALRDREQELNMQFNQKTQTLELQFTKKEQELRLKIDEIKGLHKIEKEQEVAKVQHEYNEKLVGEKERLNKDFYKKMTDEMAKMHSEGNNQTKFVQDLAIKMFDKAPSLQIEQIKKGE